MSSEASFFQSVYMWMFGGLITSAIIALMIYNSSFRFFMLQQRGMMIAVFIVQVGLVFLIGYLLKTATTNLIRALFFVYAGSMGITISLLLVIYPQNVIFKAFFTTAIVYGGLAVYGLVTKRSLERWGTFLFMALWGLLASIIINFFTKSVMFDYVISWVGVIVFAGLTAYDHQKLRVIHAGGFGSGEEEQKAIIMGAMELYIDFVALFIYIVRILGAGRD
ncbi:MAG: Bax inhibitor-1/YccA family protein [Deltaproteobacteria bacterium]|nr:Bax inhibitor-1/YccA family protein [Deltaproteobacteria bacterium]